MPETVELSLVVPMYNEEKGIEAFFGRVIPILDSVTNSYEIVCVNDGGTDRTLDLLLQVRERNPRIKVLDLSRNFGKEAALSAGLDYARGNAVIPIDADLQDPPEVIPEFVSAWRDGYEVVLGRRADRSSDSLAKRLTAALYYNVHNLVSEVPVPENVGDFRLMDRKVVEAIKLLPERRRFMKGLFAWLGFKAKTIVYRRDIRSAGKSKFSGWRLWNLAIEGITSFSTVPLRIWTYLGLVIASLAFVYGLFIILQTFIYGISVPGYASLITVVLFLGGIQLLGLGVIGEYLGRVYTESKQRPIYIVRKVYE